MIEVTILRGEPRELMRAPDGSEHTSYGDACRDMIAKGVNMLILGNDMYHLQSAFKGILAECVEPIRGK